MNQVEQFSEELRALNLVPVIEDETLLLEYSVDEIDHKAVNKLVDQYVGVWKSIGIERDNSLEERIARLRIPLSWITGADLTDDQLLCIAGKMAERLEPLPITQYWMKLMQHAIGYKPNKVDNGRFVAIRNFFGIQGEVPDWENMIQSGFATKDEKFGETVYHVSGRGIQYLSDVMGIEIVCDYE